MKTKSIITGSEVIYLNLSLEDSSKSLLLLQHQASTMIKRSVYEDFQLAQAEAEMSIHASLSLRHRSAVITAKPPNVHRNDEALVTANEVIEPLTQHNTMQSVQHEPSTIHANSNQHPHHPDLVEELHDNNKREAYPEDNQLHNFDPIQIRQSFEPTRQRPLAEIILMDVIYAPTIVAHFQRTTSQEDEKKLTANGHVRISCFK
jgi:hypothetical protein